MTPALRSILLPAVDVDALAYRNAVVANGGAVPAGYLAVVSAFIRAEKAVGLWALTDDYMALWAPNEIAALTSLKQCRLATAFFSPTFTADRGYVFNGTTQYIDTGFVPSTHAVAMTVNSVHVEVYERTNVSANNTAMGAGSSSVRNISVSPRNVGNAFGSGNSANGTFTLPTADSRGLTQIGRNGTLVTDVYGSKNGVDMTRSADPSGVGASLPSHSLVVGAFNNSGSVISFRAGSYGYVAFGAALSSAQRLARYTNVQALATAVGAQA